MAQDILIKRSTATEAPSALENGELAYSSKSDKLFIGRPGGTTGDIDAIGGKAFTDKLDGIEAEATADQTPSEIKTAYESNANTNAYTDAEKSKLAGVATSANNYQLADLNADLEGGVGNILTSGYIRGPSNFVIDPAAHGDATGTLTIAGDLVVNGTTTTVNSTEINLADNIINLNSAQDEGSLPPTSMVAGLQVDRGSAGYDAYIFWREISDKWMVSFGGPYDYELLTAISDLDGGTF